MTMLVLAAMREWEDRDEGVGGNGGAGKHKETLISVLKRGKEEVRLSHFYTVYRGISLDTVLLMWSLCTKTAQITFTVDIY